jgi:hypothetical protein
LKQQECEDVDREMPVVTCEQIKVPSSAAGGDTNAKLELAADVETVPAVVEAAAEVVVPAAAEAVVSAAADL